MFLIAIAAAHKEVLYMLFLFLATKWENRSKKFCKLMFLFSSEFECFFLLLSLRNIPEITLNSINSISFFVLTLVANWLCNKSSWGEIPKGNEVVTPMFINWHRDEAIWNSQNSIYQQLQLQLIKSDKSDPKIGHDFQIKRSINKSLIQF